MTRTPALQAPAIWVVRAGRGGRTARACKESSIVALPVTFSGDGATATTEALVEGGESRGRAPMAAALLRRFAAELQIGDRIISPTTDKDRHMVGTLTGPYRFDPANDDPELRHVRAATWSTELVVAELPTRLRRALGSPMVLYAPACQAALMKLLAEHGLP